MREWEVGGEDPFNWPFIHQFPCPIFNKSLLLSHLCLKPCLEYLCDAWWKKRCVNQNESGYGCMNLAPAYMILKFSSALCYLLYLVYWIWAQELWMSHMNLKVDRAKEDSNLALQIQLIATHGDTWLYSTLGAEEARFQARWGYVARTCRNNNKISSKLTFLFKQIPKFPSCLFPQCKSNLSPLVKTFASWAK